MTWVWRVAGAVATGFLLGAVFVMIVSLIGGGAC